jgi:ADP-ribose pyrophosphatase YjhB (NUDIX family)
MTFFWGMADPIIWKTLPKPHPLCTTSGFVFDKTGRIVLMHRSENVRSAKNCWSLPSGLHEVGLTLAEQFMVELKEELGLHAEPEMYTLGVYENIAWVDSYHWMIGVLIAQVATLDDLVNHEPDKHDDIICVDVNAFDPSKYAWAPGLGRFVSENWSFVRTIIAFKLSGCPFKNIIRIAATEVPLLPGLRSL